MKRIGWCALAVSLAVMAFACSPPASDPGGGSGLTDLMKARSLSEADVTAALKTYTPGGKADGYYLFASGG